MRILFYGGVAPVVQGWLILAGLITIVAGSAAEFSEWYGIPDVKSFRMCWRTCSRAWIACAIAVGMNLVPWMKTQALSRGMHDVGCHPKLEFASMLCGAVAAICALVLRNKPAIQSRICRGLILGYAISYVIGIVFLWNLLQEVPKGASGC